MPSTFKQRVQDVVRKIPRGSTLTYKQVAEKAGSPRAYRAVAQIMSRNFDPTIPCHRVIGSDGHLKGYNRGGVNRKAELLKTEGAKNFIATDQTA